MKQLDLWLKRTLGISGGIVLFVLMLLTVVDVAGRKLNFPIRGGVEMAEILLAMLIFAGLPLVSEVTPPQTGVGSVGMSACAPNSV